MNRDGVVDRLKRDGVLEETDAGLSVPEHVTERFDRHRDALRDVDEEVTVSRLTRRLDPERTRDAFELFDGCTELQALYLAVDDATEGFSPEQRAYVTLILDQILEPAPRLDGVPSAFVPVRESRLPPYLGVRRRALVYAWREDCEPCEVVRSELDAVFADQPPDIALLSVYGPDCAEFLSERFDVAGAPTLLFVLDGAVDARLQGVHHRMVLEREVELLRQA